MEDTCRPLAPLPDHPDLEQLRRQAKELLRAARAADPAALERFRILPSLERASHDDLAHASLALHDAQSAIAREHGFLSWNALSERVEELTLGFRDAVREFIEAATDGRTSRAERLLALHPRIAGASMHTALVLETLQLSMHSWHSVPRSLAKLADREAGSPSSMSATPHSRGRLVPVRMAWSPLYSGCCSPAWTRTPASPGCIMG